MREAQSSAKRKRKKSEKEKKNERGTFSIEGQGNEERKKKIFRRFSKEEHAVITLYCIYPSVSLIDVRSADGPFVLFLFFPSDSVSVSVSVQKYSL